MFSWVCPRCGHEVPPSKTECPFCTPPVPEPTAAPAPKPGAVPPRQYQPPAQPPQPGAVPPQQYQQPAQPPASQQPPSGGAQQAPPPQYAPPMPPPYGQQPPPYWPPQYPPQYGQQAPPYWQPQYQYPPQYAPPQFQPPQEGAPPPPQQYQPPQEAAPAPPQYAPPPAYVPPPAAEYKQPEARQPDSAPTLWPPPEQQTGKPMWLVGVLAFVGVLALLGIAYFVMGSHGSATAKDAAAKQQTANPLQKFIEVDGIRIVSVKDGYAVKFFVVNHQSVEQTDLAATVTLWASTQRSEEDSIGSFAFHIDSIGANDAKEMTAPFKTDKKPYEMPDDWRNVTADVQITAPQQ